MVPARVNTLPTFHEACAGAGAAVGPEERRAQAGRVVAFPTLPTAAGFPLFTPASPPPTTAACCRLTNTQSFVSSRVMRTGSEETKSPENVQVRAEEAFLGEHPSGLVLSISRCVALSKDVWSRAVRSCLRSRPGGSNGAREERAGRRRKGGGGGAGGRDRGRKQRGAPRYRNEPKANAGDDHYCGSRLSACL